MSAEFLSLLETEDLITRGQDGKVAQVEWEDLIRRWGRDYSLTKTNRPVLRLAPRGLEAFIGRLRTYRNRYALTGSLAMPGELSVAAARLATCYVEDPEQAGAVSDRPTETGANVMLLEPFDSLVFDRVRKEDGITKVAMSQCAVDFSGGAVVGRRKPRRSLSWMGENEDALEVLIHFTSPRAACCWTHWRRSSRTSAPWC